MTRRQYFKANCISRIAKLQIFTMHPAGGVATVLYDMPPELMKGKMKKKARVRAIARKRRVENAKREVA